ncbi:tyrosine recombinase [Erythrobacter phage vB_EliS-L02]|nr:tyrosine recombinase [Erythrobacter phage vB_EliS-L02]
MATKRAKTLNDDQFERMCEVARETSVLPERDILMLALSFKAGLRIGEIQKIDIDAMLDIEGNIADTISVFSHVGKKNRERTLPMHPLVREALRDFMKTYPGAEFVAISSHPLRAALARGAKVFTNARHERATRDTLYRAYKRIAKEAGFKGVSTHSGRRTFGTKLARSVGQHHCTIRDVQKLLGHAHLTTTEAYIDISASTRNLVAAV